MALRAIQRRCAAPKPPDPLPARKTRESNLRFCWLEIRWVLWMVGGDSVG